MQVEIDRQEGMIDPEAARADYTLHAADKTKKMPLNRNLTVWISPLFPAVQAEVDRLEGLVDAEAARADYIQDRLQGRTYTPF